MSSKRIRLSKIARNPSSSVESPSFSEYKQGRPNLGVSIPVKYWIEGNLVFPIKVGNAIFVARDIRNGHRVPGVFRSSEVISIDNDIISTKNSVYRIEFL